MEKIYIYIYIYVEEPHTLSPNSKPLSLSLSLSLSPNQDPIVTFPAMVFRSHLFLSQALFSHKPLALSLRDGNFSPPRLTRLSPLGFSPPYKGGGVRMGQDFSPTSRGRNGFRLFRPTPPLPVPAPPCVTKGYNYKFFIP